MPLLSVSEFFYIPRPLLIRRQAPVLNNFTVEPCYFPTMSGVIITVIAQPV